MITKFFNLKTVFSFTLLFLCLAVLADKHEHKKDIYHADGPYIYYKNKEVNVITTNNKGEVSNISYPANALPKSFEVYSEEASHRFTFSLHPIAIPANIYPQPAKIFVLSDPHGDFDAFVSILKAGKIINDRYEWTYGENHLVIIGDAFDRGVDVLPILWLCYKLDYESTEAGGKLHYIIGNHEDMVLSGNYKYTDDKYENISEYLKIDYKQLFDENAEMGRWLRSKNFIEKIGDNLFVHAGLSKEFLDRNLSLDVVNNTMRQYLGVGKNNMPDKSSLAFFLFDKMGPIWFRGLVKSDEKYSPIEKETLNAILAKYGVKRIVVGHTIFEEISSHQNGKVIDVNVKNDHNRRVGKARAIEIEGSKVSTVNDRQQRETLTIDR